MPSLKGSVPAYKGDLEFMKLLKDIGSKKELPEARAIMMRDIWAVKFTPPVETLQSILPAGDAQKADHSMVGEFFGQFFALYNALGEHQEKGKPFRLFEFQTVDSPVLLRKKLGHRQSELKELMPLFRDAPNLADKVDADRRIALLDDAFELGREASFSRS